MTTAVPLGAGINLLDDVTPYRIGAALIIDGDDVDDVVVDG